MWFVYGFYVVLTEGTFEFNGCILATSTAPEEGCDRIVINNLWYCEIITVIRLQKC